VITGGDAGSTRTLALCTEHIRECEKIIAVDGAVSVQIGGITDLIPRALPAELIDEPEEIGEIHGPITADILDIAWLCRYAERTARNDDDNKLKRARTDCAQLSPFHPLVESSFELVIQLGQDPPPQ
jgi:hypothetical protein